MIDAKQLAAAVTARHPGRDWWLWCQNLVGDVVYEVTGERGASYATAAAALKASRIESLDPSKAPPGAIHYWHWGAFGHVAVGLGGDLMLSTGKPWLLDGDMLAKNLGTSTVTGYTARSGTRYAGWALSNGAKPSLVKAAATSTKPKIETPTPGAQPYMGDDMRPLLVINKIRGHKQENLGLKLSIDGKTKAVNLNEWKFWRDTVGCHVVEARTDAQWRLIRAEAAELYARHHRKA